MIAVLLILPCFCACSRRTRDDDVPVLKFTVPPDWIQGTPDSHLVRYQYRLPHAAGDSEDGDLTISFVRDQPSVVQARIDQWTGQFERPGGGTASRRIERREVHGIPLTIVDLTGNYMAGAKANPKAGFRMLAAIAETETGAWFFRLLGPEDTVSIWEPSFQSFLETIE
jgi:hypothetical protein